jgi:hypothetical protein
MSAKEPTNNEEVDVRREQDAEVAMDEPASVSSPMTAPYANDVEKPVHPHIAYLHHFVKEDPVHRPYRIAAIIATGVALLTSIGSVITAGVMWQRAYDYRGTDTDRVLYAALYIFMLVESCLSFVAMLVDFSELLFRPSNVLIRDRQDLKFVGRCVTVLLLFLGAVYSFIVPIVLKDRQPKTSAALCVIPGMRLVALIIFFAVLLVDSKL